MLRCLLSLFFLLVIANINVSAQTDIDTINVCQYTSFLTTIHFSETYSNFPNDYTLFEASNFNVNYGKLHFDILSSNSDEDGSSSTTAVYYEPNSNFSGLDTFSYDYEVAHENWPTDYFTVEIIIRVNNSCIDCEGIASGLSIPDSCGVCFASPINDTFNQSCLDCDGIVNGNSIIDSCGICTLPETFNASCSDCAGILFGNNETDECGNCLLPTDSLFNACQDCSYFSTYLGFDYDSTTEISGDYNCNFCQNTGYLGEINTMMFGFLFGDNYPASVNAILIINYGANNGTVTSNYYYTTYENEYNWEATHNFFYTPNSGFTGNDTIFVKTHHDSSSSSNYLYEFPIVVSNNCIDCEGNVGGNMLTDSCGVCFESPLNPSFNASCTDCSGILLGSSVIDNCGVCTSPENFNVSCTDCQGTLFGEYELDGCGNCLIPSNENFNACLDCFNNPNGIGVIDSCGVCTLPENFNATCTDCQGTLFGEYETDKCDNCLLPTDSLFNACLDCNGIVDGGFYLDDCGNCVSPEDEYINRCTPELNKAIGDTVYYYLPHTNASEYCINTIMNDINDCESNNNFYDVDCTYSVGIEGGELLDETDFDWYKRLAVIVEAESVYLSHTIEGVAFIGIANCEIDQLNYEYYGSFSSSNEYTFFQYYVTLNESIILNELIATSDYYDCNNVLNGSSIVDTCGVCLLPQNPEFNACLDSVETSINNIELITNIFPNPAKNNITVQQQNLASVNIFDVTGKLIFTDKTKGANQLNINCSAWQAGIYFLEAKNLNGQITTQKTIVE